MLPVPMPPTPMHAKRTLLFGATAPSFPRTREGRISGVPSPAAEVARNRRRFIAWDMVRLMYE